MAWKVVVIGKSFKDISDIIQNGYSEDGNYILDIRSFSDPVNITNAIILYLKDFRMG